MKKLSAFLLMFLLIFPFVMACDDDPDKQSSDNSNPLASYTSETINADPSWDGTIVSTEAWNLDQFVSQSSVDDLMDDPTTKSGDAIDTRNMYTVNITGADGWTPRTSKGALSMPWDIFKEGYVLPKVYDAKTYWDEESSGLKKYWLVKGAQYLDLYRSIVIYITDLADPSDPESEDEDRYISFETAALTTTSLTYWNWNGDEEETVDAIKLTDLLIDYVTTDDKALYDYVFTTADAYVTDGTSSTLLNNTCDYATFQMAYYIPGADNNEKIVFIDSTDDNHQEYKSVKWIVSIEMVDNESGSPTGDYDGTTPPLFASAEDFNASIPQQ